MTEKIEEYSREKFNEAEKGLEKAKASMDKFESETRGVYYPLDSYEREYGWVEDALNEAQKKVNELKDIAHEQANKLNKELSDLERALEADKDALQRFIKEKLQKEAENK